MNLYFVFRPIFLNPISWKSWTMEYETSIVLNARQLAFVYAGFSAETKEGKQARINGGKVLLCISSLIKMENDKRNRACLLASVVAQSRPIALPQCEGCGSLKLENDFGNFIIIVV